LGVGVDIRPTRNDDRVGDLDLHATFPYLSRMVAFNDRLSGHNELERVYVNGYAASINGGPASSPGVEPGLTQLFCASVRHRLRHDLDRLRGTSLMVTTNLPFESWTEILGSERLSGATLGCLTHRCPTIETKGESYRLHDAKGRTRCGTVKQTNQPV